MKLCHLLICCLPILVNAFEVEVAEEASPVERKAAEELKKHLEKITEGKEEKGSFPRFRLTVTGGSNDMKWQVKSVPGGVELSGGGPRGVLYAVWHYLEDVCGVRWWNPWESTIPARDKLPAENLNLSGTPAFEIRDIYSVYANDEGRFASRMRLTHDGDSRISAEYGGSPSSGPPYTCHTFRMYIPERLFKTHPEWFSLVDGKRIPDGQLCLSNPQLRAEIVRRMKQFIAEGKRAREGGAQSGVMLDFVNEIAEAVEKEYPEILISTFAYQYTEQVPSSVRPRDNVMVVLCDTLGNACSPTSPRNNAYFYNLLKKWSAIARHIKIWDYAVTYQMPNEMPYPGEYAYADDLKLFRTARVQGVFTELEYPITADVRDYKIYLRAKLLENPSADFRQISETFRNGFYGAAGNLFREYRELLRKAAEKTRPHIGMYPTPKFLTGANDCWPETRLCSGAGATHGSPLTVPR